MKGVDIDVCSIFKNDCRLNKYVGVLCGTEHSYALFVLPAYSGNHAYFYCSTVVNRAFLFLKGATNMNTVRKILESHLDEIRNCLDNTYKSIELFQSDRDNKRLEANMKDRIIDAEKALPIFKPYIPEYKQRYFNILEQHNNLDMTPRDIIMTFDRMVYELHTRLDKSMTASPDMQAWSPLMKSILDGRRAVPDSNSGVNADNSLEFITSGITVVGGYVNSGCTIMENYIDMQSIKQGDILISKMTPPDIISAFDRVSGIVTEQGRRFCHAAVIAREFNIPCVVGCGSFINKVTNGETLVLDADNGIVFRNANC